MTSLTFGNPLALWALLGIPAILLIHFFQRERRQVSASTLFLLDSVRHESKRGIRFERLRHSLPLWLQIAAVVLITWVLAEPRWPAAESFQRVVVVMDSSASMMPFEETARRELDRRLSRVSRAAARNEWIAVETDSRRGTLYSGESLGELREALARWRPRSGTHDPRPGLRRALGLLQGDGALIFLTDRSHEPLPAGVHLLAVGRPVDNCGFTGIRFEERDARQIWRATLKNFSDTPQQREWRPEFPNHSGAPQSVELAPGQAITLSGVLPEGATSGTLRLNADDFPLDDQLPLIHPQPKELLIRAEQHRMVEPFLEAFLPSVPHWSSAPAAANSADLRIATRLATQQQPARPGIYFLLGEEEPDGITREEIIAEPHPLMRDLNWEGLLVEAATTPPPPGEDDQVLLWQGRRPVLVLRRSGGQQWLFCNFDLRHSNAARLPAFVVLLHRFIESVRDEKPAFERRNLETGQPVVTGADPLGGPVEVRYRALDGNEIVEELEAHRALRYSAPREPGFLDMRQGSEPLLSAAVHFADAREADLRHATSEERGADIERELRERLAHRDFLTPLWLLLLGGLMLFTWRTIR